jgi:hypothetical protein
LSIGVSRRERLPERKDDVTLHAVVRPHRSLAAAALVGALCSTRPASAQYVEYRGTIAVGVQATDNVQFAPTNPPAGVAGPSPGFVAELNPAVVVSYETPRWSHELQYALNFAALIGIGQQFNYTNRLEARSRYEVSPVTNANFALRATQGQQTFFPDPQPGQAARIVVPGTVVFTNAEIAEGLNRQLSEDATIAQQLTANVFYPVQSTPPRPAVYGVNGQLGFAYNDDPNNYGINLGSQLAVTGEIECVNDGQCGAGRVCAVATGRCTLDPHNTELRNRELAATVNAPQLATRLGGTFRHDFKNGLFSEVDLGVQQVMRLTDGGGQFWQPVGRLGLRYEDDGSGVGLTFNHGTQLDPEVGGLVFADNAELQSAFPIDRRTRNFVLQLQAGYQRGTAIDPVGAVLPGFQLFAGDAALNYRPEQRLLPNFQATLRYQMRYQITEPTPDGTRKLVELMALRNAVMINLGFEFPERKPAP